MGQHFLRSCGPTVLACLLVSGASTFAQDRWHVDHGAIGGNNGTSWQDAFVDLQNAFDAAASGDEIWVADGTYRPSHLSDPGDPRTATFELPDGVNTFGGFAGSENELNQRDWVVNPTILSGDLLGDDEQFTPSDCCTTHDGAGCGDLACESLVCAIRPTCCAGQWDHSCVAAALFVCPECSVAGNTSDNTYRVVTSLLNSAETSIDGFIITAGYADLASGTTGAGGGLFMQDSSARVRNCILAENFAHSGGAGMWVFGGSPSIEACSFSGNRTSGNGAAIWMAADSEVNTPTQISDCRFVGNVGLGPAGIYVPSGRAPMMQNGVFEGNFSATVGCAFTVGYEAVGESHIVNSQFRNNVAGAFGGAMGIADDREVSIVNCVLVGNESNRGGAITTGGKLAIRDSTLAGNSATQFGGAIYLEGAIAVTNVANSILWQNSAAGHSSESTQIHEQFEGSTIGVNFSCVEGLTGQWGGMGNTSADPLLFDLDGPDNTLGTSDDDVRLGAGSPCIDAGGNDLVPADGTDTDGDGDLDEPMPFDLARSARFQDDLNSPDTGQGGPPTVDMGAYEYGIADCNENDNPDIDDILSGTSVDCNGNLIPDECEGAECMTASYPPPGSIDAGWPFNDEGELIGWNSVEVTFNADPTPISPGAFRVESIPPGDEPQVVSVDVSGLTVTLQLDHPIQPGTWTIITHVVSGTSTRIGYLPGDVNADRTSSPVDILRLIDVLNGVMLPPPEWSTDIDRSGGTNSVDVLREIDLLMNCDPGPCWLYAALPQINE